MAGTLTKDVNFYMGAAGESVSYTWIHNLQEFPDLLGGTETVDVTTLEDGYRKYIPGIKDLGGALGFTFLYDGTPTSGNFAQIRAAEGTLQSIKIEFPDAVTESGHGTQFIFDCFVEAQVTGKGVNEALQFVCNCFLQSDIEVVEAE